MLMKVEEKEKEWKRKESWIGLERGLKMGRGRGRGACVSVFVDIHFLMYVCNLWFTFKTKKN